MGGITAVQIFVFLRLQEHEIWPYPQPDNAVHNLPSSSAYR